MKILLANYRYFLSGGPERYMFNVTEALERHGHNIVPFSIRYTKNRPSNYDNYFVSPLAGDDAITFAEHRWTAHSFVKTLERSFYSKEVEHAAGRLADAERPDIAYLLHFLRKLSPSLLVALKKRGIPVVVRVSDFLWVCPAIHCLRDGQPCTLCTRANLRHSVRHRCVQHSLGASLVSFFSAHYHRWRGYFDLIDRFVLTNAFTMEQMVRAGWPRERMTVIHTFANRSFFTAVSTDKGSPGYILFCGHLEPHKGPELLIRAYARALANAPDGMPDLKIAARTNTSCARACQDLVRGFGLSDRISFLEFVDEASLPDLYARARATVIPSLCFENLPNALIESYASGTAVIGPQPGSLASFIDEGKTGYLFELGDEASLASCLTRIGSEPAWCDRAGKAAREKAVSLFSQDRHVKDLLSLFGGLRHE